jgi:hypothetical protein
MRSRPSSIVTTKSRPSSIVKTKSRRFSFVTHASKTFAFSRRARRALRVSAFAFASFAALFSHADVASAGPATLLPPGCVADLKDVRTTTNGTTFASHYVTDGGFGYGEFSTGGFGGQSLWQRRGGAWCRVQTGAAILDRAALIGFGVPPATAARLLALMKSSGELAPPVPPRPPAVSPHH